jgi:hypothetical protein
MKVKAITSLQRLFEKRPRAAKLFAQAACSDEFRWMDGMPATDLAEFLLLLREAQDYLTVMEPGEATALRNAGEHACYIIVDAFLELANKHERPCGWKDCPRCDHHGT